MIADVSLFTNFGMILLIVLAAFVLIGFLKGLLNGFWKSVVSLILWIALIIGIVKFAPQVGEELAKTGFIENLLAGVKDTEVGAFVLGLIGPTIYTIIAVIVALIIGGIVIGLLNAIVKSIFKRKGLISRLVGAIFTTAFNAAIAVILFVFASSPLLFKGADEQVKNNQYLVMLDDMIVNPVQEILKQNGIPSEVDEIALVLLGQEATEENLASFNRLVLGMSDEETYFKSFVDGGKVNEAKIEESYADLVYFSKIVNDMDEGTVKNSLSGSLQDLLVKVLSNFENANGVVLLTTTVSAEKYDELNLYMSNLKFDAELVNRVNSVFIRG